MNSNSEYARAKWAEKLGVSISGYYTWLHDRKRRQAATCNIRMWRRRRPLTDSRKARGDEYHDLTKGLRITAPFQVLSSDISYIRTGEGFDYLCQIRDVHTNTVLAACQAQNMKKEIVHWHFYPTREAARQAVFEYIEGFYNRRRVQKRLGYLSPIQFLNAWQQQPLSCSA